MKPGTIVRLPDGREGTLVYRGIDGEGILWGRVALPPADIAEIYSGNPVTGGNAPKGWRWNPDAMLRAPYAGADIECVGSDYEIVEEE